jgi:hypothetical protein
MSPFNWRARAQYSKSTRWTPQRFSCFIFFCRYVSSASKLHPGSGSFRRETAPGSPQTRRIHRRNNFSARGASARQRGSTHCHRGDQRDRGDRWKFRDVPLPVRKPLLQSERVHTGGPSPRGVLRPAKHHARRRTHLRLRRLTSRRPASLPLRCRQLQKIHLSYCCL